MDGSRLRITGAWTKAGVASCVHVQGSQKIENLLFDCGFMNSDTTYAKFVFISHGHIDHVGCCINHARAKALSGSLAIYYVPRDILPHLIAAKDAFEKLDESTIPMNIVGVGPGDEIVISPTLKVNVFATLHRVPSQGYAISTIKKGELLPELRNMTGEEIRELKMMGQTIHGPETEELEMVYTGDTTMDGLLQLGSDSRVFRSHTFVTEVTYLDGDRSKAAQYGHVHLQDVVDHAHLFRYVTHLVIVHISQKYSVSRVLKLLRDALPGWLQAKVLVSLHSFGAREHLTRLADERWERQERGTAGWGWSNHKAQRTHQQYEQHQHTQQHEHTQQNEQENERTQEAGNSRDTAGMRGAAGGGGKSGGASTSGSMSGAMTSGTSGSVTSVGKSGSVASGSTNGGTVAGAGSYMALLATSSFSTDPTAAPVATGTGSSTISSSSSGGSGGAVTSTTAGALKYSEAVRSSGGYDATMHMPDADWDDTHRRKDYSGGSSYSKGQQRNGKHGARGSSANAGGANRSKNWHKKSLRKPYKQPGQVYHNNSA